MVLSAVIALFGRGGKLKRNRIRGIDQNLSTQKKQKSVRSRPILEVSKFDPYSPRKNFLVQNLGVPFSLLFALARSSTSSAGSRLPFQDDNENFDLILVVIPRSISHCFAGESGEGFIIARERSIFADSILTLLSFAVSAHIVLVESSR